MSKVIAPFLFLTIAAGLFFSYVKPAYQGVQVLKAQEARLITIINDSQSLEETVRRHWGTYLGMRTDKGKLERLEQLLPDEIDVVQTIIDIDDIASRYNITINSFQVPQLGGTPNVRGGRDADNDTYEKATFSIDSEGKYPDLKKFLTEIETNLSLMDVSNISVAAADPTKALPGEDPDVQEFKITIDTYWLK